MVITFFFVSISIIHYDRPAKALEAIKERKARLDLALTDVYMPLFYSQKPRLKHMNNNMSKRHEQLCLQDKAQHTFSTHHL